MTTHLTKIWWDVNNHKLVEQDIPGAEIYKREWVGLTEEEIKILWIQYRAALPRYLCFALALEAKLKEKNT